MLKYSEQIIKQWLWLPIIVGLFQIFFLAHYGYSMDDAGYILGMSYRILNGEAMYTDFIYARPPLSPYFWAFWMWVVPEDGAYYYIKVIVYLIGILYSTLAVLTLRRFIPYFDKVMPMGFAIAFFEVLNLNFLNHPWHTMDGILFATIATFLLIDREKVSTNRLVMGVLAIILSMAAKQSFYPLPFILLFAMWIMYGWQRFVYALVLFIVVFDIVLFALYLLFPEQLYAFMEIKQYRQQIKPFLDAAFLVYLKDMLKLLAVMPMLVLAIKFDYLWLLVKQKKHLKAYRRFSFYMAKSYLVLFSLIMIYQATVIAFEIPNGFITNFLPFTGGLALGIIWIGLEIRYKRLNNRDYKAMLMLVLFFSLGWLTSLSWGYKTPAFMSGPIVFFFAYLIYYYTRKKVPMRWMLVPFATYLLSSWLTVYGAIDAEEKHMGEFSKVMNKTYTRNMNSYARQIYINDKIKKCNGEYEVLPTFTMQHWWDGTRPLTPIDWASNAELVNKRDMFYDAVNKVDCVIYDPFYVHWHHSLFKLETSRINGVVDIDLDHIHSDNEYVLKLINRYKNNQMYRKEN